jgi:DNA-directed RNA polymerase subunit H (RpoH/RPB5)
MLCWNIIQPTNDTTMELTDWQSQRIEASIGFILDQRVKRSALKNPEPQYDITDVGVHDDNSKNIVIKVSNTILNESAKNSNFIVVVHVNQYNRNNLLHELLDVIQPQNYCKVFFVDELIANPIGNKMVPKHELCTRKMVESLLQKHSIVVDALPNISLRDPIVRWYGWQVGDIIKITRPNGELYYRMVV